VKPLYKGTPKAAQLTTTTIIMGWKR